MTEIKQKAPTVSSTEVQRNFRDVLRRLNAEGALIIERDGVPAAVLVPLEQHHSQPRQPSQAERQRQFEAATRSFSEAVAESGMTEDEVLASLEASRHAVQEKRYGKR